MSPRAQDTAHAQPVPSGLNWDWSANRTSAEKDKGPGRRLGLEPPVRKALPPHQDLHHHLVKGAQSSRGQRRNGSHKEERGPGGEEGQGGKPGGVRGSEGPACCGARTACLVAPAAPQLLRGSGDRARGTQHTPPSAGCSGTRAPCEGESMENQVHRAGPAQTHLQGGEAGSRW